MTKTLCCLRACICLFTVVVFFPAASLAAQADAGRQSLRVSTTLANSAAQQASAAAPAASAATGAGQNSASSGWQALIAGHITTPPRMVVVDKTRQTLYVLERQSPLRVTDQYICTTGQAEGDKLVRGDLKTPEGIYFVSQRLASGLDFIKYGSEAYTLNYPNPVDRLRKKTGYGIWIHGRGTPIVPKETQGCVALNNGDIAILGKNLPLGTPVALAAAVSFNQTPPQQEKALLASLEKRTHGWAKAWSNRSKTMFDYYDPDAYSVAQGESFSAFRNQKERLFKQLPWIETKVHDVQTMQGPGYWVTWFQQDYRAPNLSTKGVRRLYWQRDSKGELRIVGMEWAPNLYGTLTASLGNAGEAATPPVEANPRSEEDLPVGGKIPAAKPPVATQVAQASPAASPAATGTPAPAAAPAATASPVAAPSVPTKPVATSAPATAPPVAKPPAPAPVAVAMATPPVSAPAAVPPTPAKPATASPTASPAKADPAAELEKAAADGAVFVETWRKAWENSDRKAYMACYDKNAVQGERKGVDAIESHKRKVWASAPPKRVKLANLRITVTTSGISADMNQDYADKSGFRDKGIKTLTLKRINASWRIVREDWSPVTP